MEGVEGVDYLKDMVLLFIATAIAWAVLVLDLIFRVYEKKINLENKHS